MFKKLKKKLEEGEEGGMDFTPRRLPGSVVRSSSGDAASMAGTDSDVAAGTKEGHPLADSPSTDHEIADTERRLRSRNFEIEVLETRLAAQMKERLDEQEAAIELQLRLEASCKDLTQKLEQLRSEYQQSTRELEGQREEGERRDARMGMLEVELQQCTHKYQQLELQCGEAEGRHRAQMEEVSRHHSAVMQGMEEELVEARVQISALQEELKSLQVSSCTEVHAMDCTSQGEEGEPAILQVDTCDGHTREDTELESLRTEVSQLQEELAEKNKTIKLQLQKMADMKKALHKELKPQVSVESTPAVPTPSTPKDMTRVAIASEVNFQYLKNVVIKFICSREEEALQLICALSTLLELSPQEVEHIKQYLEYKSSWFGSQPTPLQYQRHSQKRSI